MVRSRRLLTGCYSLLQAPHRGCAELVAHMLHGLPELLHVQPTVAVRIELPEQLCQVLPESVPCR